MYKVVMIYPDGTKDGHDQRAIHDRISRQWGDTLGFIEWFDSTYPRVAV